MSTQTRNISAALYLRISQDSEATGLGVARQRADCEALADAKGWTVMGVFEDNDVSATSGKPRPEYQRMVREIEAGRIQGIVVWDVDRLTRTPRELEDVISWADRHGLALASVGGEIDLSTPQGRMMARIKGTVARHETEQSARRIKRSKQQLAEQGQHRGVRPYGWTVTTDKQLIVDPAEAAVIREAYKRILAGETIFGIAADLNRRGILTIKGNAWSAASLRAVVKRWRNCGVSTYRGKEVGPGSWESIVDRETHERLLAMLSDPRRRPANRGTAPKYLLTHLINCAECGDRLAGSKERTYAVTAKLASGPVKRTRTFPASYKCTRPGCQAVTRSMADLDELISGYVVGFLEREGVEVLGGDSTAAETARARVEALEAKLSLAADQWTDDQITAEQLQRINAKLRPQLDDARAEYHRAMPTAAGLAEFTGPTARQAWEDATLERRRQIIGALLDAGMSVIVGKVGKPGGRWIKNEFDPETIEVRWRGREAAE